MNLSVGIVGFPNVGKSTLFNALLKKQVAAAQNYPFTTIDPNIGVVDVPDDRLKKLKNVVESSEGLRPEFKVVPAIVKFVDIAGLVKGAAQGEGLGNQFLSHIREVDLIVFVLRDFSGDIIRAGSENPIGDLEVLKSELFLKDLETISKRVDVFSRDLKGKTPNDSRHGVLQILDNAKKLVEGGKWLRDELAQDEVEKIADLQLLSAKKTIYVVNSDEEDLQKPSSIEGGVRLSVKMEEELTGLSDEEQKEYLSEIGQNEPGLNILIRKAYESLDLVSYFTAGPKEIKAWTIKEGTLAPAAAGVIHSDFERGFIAADVIGWEEFVSCGGWKKAKDAGKVKTVGSKEQIRDGDVVEFRFNV